MGFFAEGRLKTVRLSGGLPNPLAPAPFAFGADWGEDEHIIYSPTLNSGLWRVPEGGGQPGQLTAPDPDGGEYGHVHPQYLPDGHSVLFSVWGPRTPAILSLDTGQWEAINLSARSGQAFYLSTGHLLFASGPQVEAIPFDPASLSAAGSSAGVLTDAARSVGFVFSTANNGTLAYLPKQPSQLVWVDRRGNKEPLEVPTGEYGRPRLSPGGNRVAALQSGGVAALLVIDIASGTPTTIPTPGRGTLGLVWMDDGTLIFGSNRADNFDIYYVDVDSGGAMEAILVKAFDQMPSSWLPEERLLAYREINPVTGADIWLLDLDDGEPRPLVVTSGYDRFAQFSPDGNWVAYASDESGRDQVFICSLTDCTGVRRTVGFGSEPHWSPDSRDLFFRHGNQVMAREITDASTMTLGNETRMLFEDQFRYPTFDLASYDLHPDGDRFLMISDPTNDEIRVILNWVEELKELVPVP